MPNYAHQTECVELSWDRPGFAYFLDTGTGKTKIALDVASRLYKAGKIDGMLVTATKGGYRTWTDEQIPKWLTCQAQVAYWTPDANQKELRMMEMVIKVDCPGLDIFVMNIEAFSTKTGKRWAERFLIAHNSVLWVADESTTIKNPTAARTKNVLELARRSEVTFKRIMSGFPVTKLPQDLYTQCLFLGQEYLGYNSWYTFRAHYQHMRRVTPAGSKIEIDLPVGTKNLDELNQVLQTFSYRKRKEECLDLPPKTYIRQDVQMTARQAKVYEEVKKQAFSVLQKEEEESKTHVVSITSAMAQMAKLHQIACGFVIDDQGQVNEISDERVQRTLERLEETSGKVVIWASYRYLIQTLGKAVSARFGANSLALYYGLTPGPERSGIIRRFQDPDDPLRFLISHPRTGKFSLTLTSADLAIYFSNTFDWEDRVQSEDRIYRIGQMADKVTYIDMIVPGTVEEHIIESLRGKDDISRRVMADGWREWI